MAIAKDALLVLAVGKLLAFGAHQSRELEALNAQFRLDYKKELAAPILVRDFSKLRAANARIIEKHKNEPKKPVDEKDTNKVKTSPSPNALQGGKAA
jgi:hypothetical protein